MRTGGFLLTAAMLLAAGCAAQQTVAIRPLGTTPLATGSSANARVAYANAQLGLGNVALALEAYRRASREDPSSVAALLGMADCYDRMERFDLSRRNYETALALRPTDAAVLARFAASLDRAGDGVGAAQVRKEAQARASGSVTTTLVAAAEPQAAPDVASTAAASVSVALTSSEQPTVAARTSGPRLERLSLEEVALVTTAPPRWRSLADVSPNGLSVPVRILNAARVQGLAARTRTQLRQLGWRGLSIGNAPAVQTASLILYPAPHRADAEQLGREAGVVAFRPTRGRDIVMLLGRDLARRNSSGAR